MQRRSSFLWARAESESRAGKSLSRRVKGERPMVRPVPALRKKSRHDRASCRRRCRRAALDACCRYSHLCRCQGRPADLNGSRTRPSNRCSRPAWRHGGRLRRLGRSRRLELEDRLRRLRGGNRSLPAQVRSGHARQGWLDCRDAADARENRKLSADPYAAPRTVRRSSNFRRRSRLGWPHAPQPALGLPTAFWSHPRGPACSPSWPSSPAALSC